MSNPKGLGEKLVEKGILKQEDYEKILARQKQDKVSLFEAILDSDAVGEEQFLSAVSEILTISVITGLTDIADEEVVKSVPEEIVRKYNIMPLFKAGDLMMLATLNPLDIFALDEVAKAAGCKVEPALSPRGEIARAIDKFYGHKNAIDDIVAQAKEDEAVIEIDEDGGGEAPVKDAKDIEAPIIKLVNMIITEAIKKGASDIHVEPEEDRLRVRYRIDGVLKEEMFPPRQLQPMILSRLKLMSGMDIAEHRLPQDGRFKIHSQGKHLDVRVSSVPAIFGEKIVMRLLDQSSIHLELKDLNFGDKYLKEYNAVIRQPHGIILVTGPTGSGKTTTLYTSLEDINSPEKNIMTIEDPVEYHLKGVNQIQVHSKIGLTFASVLRTALRQDPNIIMIGEMRDTETAETAIRAALTGHLVFSTLHTNDAPGAMTRLMDMGLAPYLIASSVTCILAQRLVRGICPECKITDNPSPTLLAELGIKDGGAKFYKGKGCKKCDNGGYKGRLGVYEFMFLNDEIRRLTIERASAGEIKKAAQKAGMKTLLEDGLGKAAAGKTTLEEVQRVLLAE